MKESCGKYVVEVTLILVIGALAWKYGIGYLALVLFLLLQEVQ